MTTEEVETIILQLNKALDVTINTDADCIILMGIIRRIIK